MILLLPRVCYTNTSDDVEIQFHKQNAHVKSYFIIGLFPSQKHTGSFKLNTYFWCNVLIVVKLMADHVVFFRVCLRGFMYVFITKM